MKSKGGNKQLAKQLDRIYKEEKEFIKKVLKFLPAKSSDWKEKTEDEDDAVLIQVEGTAKPEIKSNKRLKLLQKKRLKRLNKKPKKVIKTEVVDVNGRTPLKRASVKKENGELVYSKFDFISDDKKPKEFTINQKSEDPELVLKKVEKQESVIKKLKEKGEISKAVSMEEQQKWNNALQRAKGTKVKDDPALLKKSIKRQEKIKKVKQKKWEERVNFQEKMKTQRNEKRQSNIQGKKEERMKRQKKILRKKGRIL